MTMSESELTAEMAIQALIAVATHSPPCGKGLVSHLMHRLARARGDQQTQIIAAGLLTAVLDKVPSLRDVVDGRVRDHAKGLADGAAHRMERRAEGKPEPDEA